MRFHINPKTGNVNTCRAKKQCRFGLTQEQHFATREEAQAAYEKKQQGKVWPQSDNKQQALMRAFATAEAAHKRFTDAETQFEETSNAFYALRKQVQAGETVDLQELSRLTQEVEAQTDALRANYYARVEAVTALQKLESAEADGEWVAYVSTFSSIMKQRKFFKTAKANVNFHQMTPTYREAVLDEFVSWSGLEKAEADRLLSEAENCSDDPAEVEAAGVRLFQQYQQQDRTFTFVDIETNGATPVEGEIIEVGVVVTDANGKVLENLSEVFDLQDPTHREAVPLRFEATHHINASEIAGKPSFVAPESQERMQALLNNPKSILVAHNALFERQFFDHFVPEFRAKHDKYSPELLASGDEPNRVLDTRMLSGLLSHNVRKNTLNAFTESNGVAYEGAHRAHTDAAMTAEAFFNFRKTLTEGPAGERPMLTLPEQPA